MSKSQTGAQEFRKCISVLRVPTWPWWLHAVLAFVFAGIGAGLVVGKLLIWKWIAWHSAALLGIVLGEFLLALIGLVLVVRWRKGQSWQDEGYEALNQYIIASNHSLAASGVRDATQSVCEPVEQSVWSGYVFYAVLSMILCVPIFGSFLLTVAELGAERSDLAKMWIPMLGMFGFGAITLTMYAASISIVRTSLNAWQSSVVERRATEIHSRVDDVGASHRADHRSIPLENKEQVERAEDESEEPIPRARNEDDIDVEPNQNRHEPEVEVDEYPATPIRAKNNAPQERGGPVEADGDMWG